MDWDYLAHVVDLHLLLEHVQVDVVLQPECLLGDLVLVVPWLWHLLVGWVLEVIQWVFCWADLGDDVGNLLLNLLSLELTTAAVATLSNFLVAFLLYLHLYFYLYLYLFPVLFVQILFYALLLGCYWYA